MTNQIDIKRGVHYTVIYDTEKVLNCMQSFKTLKEAKDFAHKHFNCVINRWFNEYDDDISFKSIEINVRD